MPTTTPSNFSRARAALRFVDMPTFGNVFFVSSVTGSATGGYTPDAPAATIAQALALCTASKGDIIFVAPDHVESIGASGLAWNVAGVSIIGLGNGLNRPTLTWHTTDAVVTVSGANMLIKNIITAVDLDEVVSMFLVTGAGVTFDEVDFEAVGTSAQAIQWLKTTNAADRLTIKNCKHRQLTAAAAAQKWIELVGPDFARIVDNEFQIVANASTSSELISGSTAVVYCTIARNLIEFIGATIDSVINLVTGSTGIISDNRIASGTSVATAAAITGDGCFMFNNLWADTAAASGLLAPGVDTDT
jgi:hypothetical protein